MMSHCWVLSDCPQPSAGCVQLWVTFPSQHLVVRQVELLFSTALCGKDHNDLMSHRASKSQWFSYSGFLESSLESLVMSLSCNTTNHSRGVRGFSSFLQGFGKPTRKTLCIVQWELWADQQLNETSEGILQHFAVYVIFIGCYKHNILTLKQWLLWITLWLCAREIFYVRLEEVWLSKDAGLETTWERKDFTDWFL